MLAQCSNDSVTIRSCSIDRRMSRSREPRPKGIMPREILAATDRAYVDPQGQDPSRLTIAIIISKYQSRNNNK